MDNPKRARSEKPRKQPRECAYVRSPDLQSVLERIRQVACRDKGARFTALWHHVYNVDRFSYGFRPGRNPHNALDALYVGIMRKRVNWMLDADIRGFFDAIDHEWLMKFVEHRIADQRVLRHIRKWLNAGVMEDGKRTQAEKGTSQGGSVSPLLANVYLHYVFDLWVHQWRKRHARGEVIIVRFADDFTVGFQYREDAERFLEELRERFQRFHLELHPEKTRLMEFGRYAAENRKRRGEGKPESFDFLGFTHTCDKTRNGKFIVLRQTMRKRLQSKLREIKIELKRRLHHPVPEVGQWLRSVMQGHFNYYAVPRNQRKLGAFKYQVYRLWLRTLRQRSQRHRMTGGAHEPFGRPLVSTYSYFAPVPRTATARHDLR